MTARMHGLLVLLGTGLTLAAPASAQAATPVAPSWKGSESHFQLPGLSWARYSGRERRRHPVTMSVRGTRVVKFRAHGLFLMQCADDSVDDYPDWTPTFRRLRISTRRGKRRFRGTYRRQVGAATLTSVVEGTFTSPTRAHGTLSSTTDCDEDDTRWVMRGKGKPTKPKATPRRPAARRPARRRRPAPTRPKRRPRHDDWYWKCRLAACGPTLPVAPPALY